MFSSAMRAGFNKVNSNFHVVNVCANRLCAVIAFVTKPVYVRTTGNCVEHRLAKHYALTMKFSGAYSLALDKICVHNRFVASCAFC